MVTKIPIIEQCTVHNTLNKEIMIEDLADYLIRNENLVFPHRHNFYHFVLFIKGGGNHSIDFETFEVEPWQIYFMNPGQIHTWEFSGDMEGFVVNFDKDFFKNFLLRTDYLSNFSFFSGIVRDGVFTIDPSKRDIAFQLMEQMRMQTDNRDFVSVTMLYLFHFLEEQREKVSSVRTNAYNHTVLRNFLNLIDLNYKNLRLPKEYANLLYITPNHLNALCKELLGQSAGEIIRNRILLEAKRLLAMKDLSVAEVAYELNFNDNSYFTKFFKKIEGMTPEEFRRK